MMTKVHQKRTCFCLELDSKSALVKKTVDCLQKVEHMKKWIDSVQKIGLIQIIELV